MSRKGQFSFCLVLLFFLQFGHNDQNGPFAGASPTKSNQRQKKHLKEDVNVGLETNNVDKKDFKIGK